VVRSLEGAVGPENVRRAVEKIMRGNTFDDVLTQHSVFPLRRYLLAHGSRDLFTYEEGEKSPIEKYMPKMPLSEDLLETHIVLSAFDDDTKSKFSRLFKKSLPGPCVVRNLMRLLWGFCQDEAVYRFVRSIFQCSVLGLYRGARRRDARTRYELWTKLDSMCDSEFRTLLSEKNQLLFFFTLREYVCHAVRSIAPLHELLCTHCKWRVFEETVATAMDRVRDNITADFTGMETILREFNKSKYGLRRGASLVETLARDATPGSMVGHIGDAPGEADRAAFARFCQLRTNFVAYNLPRQVLEAQERVCMRRNFSAATYVCLGCRCFKGFLVQKKKTKRGMRVVNLSAFGSKQVVKNLDDGELYCAKSKQKECTEPLVQVSMLGKMLFFHKKFYTICVSCGCFMTYTGHWKGGPVCGFCDVGGVFMLDVSCKFCEGKEKLKKVTVRIDGARTEVHLCQSCLKRGQFILNASSVLDWADVYQGLHDQWRSLKE